MAAQTAPIFRASVALVHVDAEVTLDGRILSGLTKDDFRVFDERSPQTVVHFASEQEPLDLILLFDFSNSMRPVVQSVAAVARQGLQELRQGDRVWHMDIQPSQPGDRPVYQRPRRRGEDH